MTDDGISLRTPRDMGAFIRSARRKSGLTQKQLAEKVGVSDMWISGLERGNGGARFNLILRTLSILGLQLQGSSDDSKDEFDILRQVLES